jgi:VIT1/CCC1 family predicted Fe2+/Mn2+ transporter
MTSPTEERAPPDPRLLLTNLRNELDSADLYRYLASRETDAMRASLLNEMADAEIHHARVMERGLRNQGVPIPRYRVGPRSRVLKTIARFFGPGLVYPLILGTEIAGSADYAAQDEATAALATDERSHARTLGQLSGRSPTAAARPEHWHRSSGGGSLRAAVFGVNDGLVSNLSLVMGVAGATADPNFILLAGLSGLLAGASSMAAGEYVSVKAQRELFERQIELEAAELAVNPVEEQQELALIYRAKGIPKADAERLAQKLLENPDVALDSLVREELGLDPNALGSHWGAATSSFISFAIGAILPVLPFFFGASLFNVVLSLVISGTALFSVGAAVSLLTGRSSLYSGARQLLIGAAAALVTFVLGKLIGVSTGI